MSADPSQNNRPTFNKKACARRNPAIHRPIYVITPELCYVWSRHAYAQGLDSAVCRVSQNGKPAIRRDVSSSRPCPKARRREISTMVVSIHRFAALNHRHYLYIQWCNLIEHLVVLSICLIICCNILRNRICTL